jgi:hypothetical protein
MTVAEVLELYYEEHQNDISENMLLGWIAELDTKIVSELNKGREGLSEQAFLKDMETSFTLNAPKEYSEIYTVYLSMRTAYFLGEIERYNNSAMLFNRLSFEMSNFISRNYKLKDNRKIKVEFNNA